MKKFLSIILLCVVILGSAGCADKNTQDPELGDQTVKIVNSATKCLTSKWLDYYKSSSIDSDRYLEIKNVRVIAIKNNDIATFNNVKYVVEYVLFTDYYGSHPYYVNVGAYDSVIVYNDGNMDVSNANLFRAYIARTYSTDFSDIIESIQDCGTFFNKTYILK